MQKDSYHLISAKKEDLSRLFFQSQIGSNQTPCQEIKTSRYIHLGYGIDQFKEKVDIDFLGDIRRSWENWMPVSQKSTLDSESHSKAQSFRLALWLNIIKSLRKTSEGSIHLLTVWRTIQRANNTFWSNG